MFGGRVSPISVALIALPVLLLAIPGTRFLGGCLGLVVLCLFTLRGSSRRRRLAAEGDVIQAYSAIPDRLSAARTALPTAAGIVTAVADHAMDARTASTPSQLPVGVDDSFDNVGGEIAVTLAFGGICAALVDHVHAFDLAEDEWTKFRSELAAPVRLLVKGKPGRATLEDAVSDLLDRIRADRTGLVRPEVAVGWSFHYGPVRVSAALAEILWQRVRQTGQVDLVALVEGYWQRVQVSKT